MRWCRSTHPAAAAFTCSAPPASGRTTRPTALFKCCCPRMRAQLARRAYSFVVGRLRAAAACDHIVPRCGRPVRGARCRAADAQFALLCKVLWAIGDAESEPHSAHSADGVRGKEAMASAAHDFRAQTAVKACLLTRQLLPQSLHLLLALPCWQMPLPPQSLHWYLTLPCWQKPLLDEAATTAGKIAA